jgi:hypothetical protein
MANTAPPKTIVDLEMQNRLNADGCPACGRKFTLGETVVYACGPWQGMKYIHEKEAVYDSTGDCFYERRHYEQNRS